MHKIHETYIFVRFSVSLSEVCEYL